MAGEGDHTVIEKAVAGAIAVTAVVQGVKRHRSSPGQGQPRQDCLRARPPGRPTPACAARAGPGQGPADERDHAAGAGKGGGAKRLAKSLDGYQRCHAWLGFPLAVVKKFGEDQAGNLAALISYYTFFSLFPLLLALVTILGYVLHGDPAMQQRIVGSALAQFPVIGDQIRSNIGSLSGSGVALIVGVGGALWAGMGAVDATQNAMNSVWDVPIRDKPAFLKRRLRSLIMLGVIGSGLLATAAASTVASSADSIGPVGRLVAPAGSLFIGVGVFMLAFRVLTEADLGWSDVFPGAVVAAVAAVAFQLVGGFYLDHSLRGASQTYGTFAIVIGLLSWLYLQAQVTLLAAEVNVVRTRRLWPRSLTQDPDDLTDADRDALAQHAEVEERVPDQDVRTALPDETHERGVDPAPVPGQAAHQP